MLNDPVGLLEVIKMNWSFEHITTWEGVLSATFQDRWRRWANEASNPNVFLHPAMGNAWIETYRKLRCIEPKFIVAKSGKLEFFVPLILWRRNWKHAAQRVLTSIGHSDFDYLEPLGVNLDSNSSWDRIWEPLILEIQSRWGSLYDIFELGCIRSPYIGAMNLFTQVDESPFLDLSSFSSGEEFWNWMGSKQRTEIRRRQRKLEQLGSIDFHVFRPEEEHLAQDSLLEMLKTHSCRWPNAYKAPGFHRNLISHLLRAGILHFSEIRLNGRAISWRIGFVSNSRFHSYMPAFLQEYSTYSPGILHMVKCIEDAIRMGFKTYDYLRGAETYKEGWTSGTTGSFRLVRSGKTFNSCLRNFGSIAIGELAVRSRTLSRSLRLPR